MTDFGDASDEELKAELERRERAKSVPIPTAKPMANVDWTNVYETAKSCLETASKLGFWDEDNRHYIYESVLTAIYGDTFWQWKRAQGW